MCGIAAIFNYRTTGPVDRAELTRIRDHMIDRGPDGCGEWVGFGGRLAMGHRRLSIIDLSEAASQPMHSSDGKLTIVFNGEIYNYRQLRSELEDRGRRFKSNSDTEIILEGYVHAGPEFVKKLRGMFAFAIWDERDRSLFLARDLFGIKPLYYADDGRTMRVASQVKALRAGGGVSAEPEPAGHVGFFLWGHVPDPYTLFKGIRALPAGTTLRIDSTGSRQTAIFGSVRDLLADFGNGYPAMAESEREEHLRSALLDAVEHHLLADVPVGVFLSAGLDSTTLAALATERCGRLKTVTLGFEEYRGTDQDETGFADKVAQHYQTDHQTVWVSRKDFETHFDQLLRSMDQPSIDGVNTYFVSLAAKRAGLKVALSGLGGDELFGGYSSFHEVPRLVRSLRIFARVPALGMAARRVLYPFVRRISSPKYAGLLEYGGTYAGAYLLRRSQFMPWELPEVLPRETVELGLEELSTLEQIDQSVRGLDEPNSKMAGLEMQWYMRSQLLRDSDWAGMAHSIEIRVPFVDTALCRRSGALRGVKRHWDKREIARSCRPALPSCVTKRAKSGFSIPVREWLLKHHSAASGLGAERSLRGWARLVYQTFTADFELGPRNRSAIRSLPAVAHPL